MAGSAKLFQFVQKCLQTFGIHPCQSSPKQNSTNWTQVIFLIGLVQYTLTAAAFLWFHMLCIGDYD